MVALVYGVNVSLGFHSGSTAPAPNEQSRLMIRVKPEKPKRLSAWERLLDPIL